MKVLFHPISLIPLALLVTLLLFGAMRLGRGQQSKPVENTSDQETSNVFPHAMPGIV